MSTVLAAALAATPEPDEGYGWSFVVAGWSIVVGSLAAYVAALWRRGRALSQRVPPEERRWM